MPKGTLYKGLYKHKAVDNTVFPLKKRSLGSEWELFSL